MNTGKSMLRAASASEAEMEATMTDKFYFTSSVTIGETLARIEEQAPNIEWDYADLECITRIWNIAHRVCAQICMVNVK
jgi:hypothetical protein